VVPVVPSGPASVIAPQVASAIPVAPPQQAAPPLIPVQPTVPVINPDGEVDLTQLHAKEISIDEEGNLKIPG
jgi:hypothetical protein